MKDDSTAMIFQIQHFSVHDGPGIRTSVFFKGCDLRCFWCHNPESQQSARELRFYQSKCIGCGACVTVCLAARNGRTARLTPSCLQCGACVDQCYAGALKMTGTPMTVDAIMEDILRDRDAYISTGGGVTLSGGEPLLHPQFVLRLLKACRREGIHTGIETASHVPQESIRQVLPFVDLYMTDIKTMDEAAHKTGTGVSLSGILDNIRYVASSETDLVIRTPVVPRFNDTDQDISAIADFLLTLPNCGRIRWELLPFRNLCASKYVSLGRTFEAADIQSPPDADMYRFERIARDKGIACQAVV